MNKIKIAFIGSGFIQNYHAKGLQSQKDVELVTVADINLKAAKDFANKYGISETTDDVLSPAKKDNIDAVIISTPNKFHAPYAIEFLKNGKDVFVEKPMAINSQVGEIMAEVAVEPSAASRTRNRTRMTRIKRIFTDFLFCFFLHKMLS